MIGRKLLPKISYITVAMLMLTASCVASVMQAAPAHAAACTPPGTDYGTVTFTTSVSSAGVYRIWTRMAAPNSTDNSFLLDIDSTTCYTVGGASVPTYASGSTTRFANNKTNWIARTTGGAFIDVNLTSGSHTLKLIGTSAGVVVDRVILTKDDGCSPTSNGANCATTIVAADINSDTKVNFLDLSTLAAKYNQTGGSIGRSDINLDGVVDILDFSLLANKYGQ